MSLISFDKDSAECNISISSLDLENIEAIELEMADFLDNLMYYLKGHSDSEYLKYWDYFESKELKMKIEPVYLFFKDSKNFEFLNYYADNIFDSSKSSTLYDILNIFDFIEYYESWDDQIEFINSSFVEDEIERNKEFFDELNLNDGQRAAVVVDEDSTQIIAGAGTGKTRTLIANVKYLIEKKKIEPSKILCLSYNISSTDDLRRRIRSVGIPATKSIKKGKVRVATFHSFGLRFSNRTYDADKIKELFINYLKETLAKDISIFENFKLYFSSEFNNMSGFSTEDNDGVAIKFKDTSHGEFESIRKGVIVKSYEDLVIANFLILNDVKFRYRYKYPVEYTDNFKDYYVPDTSSTNPNERNYLKIESDFYLPDYSLYIEDNRIDKEGNPSWINNIFIHGLDSYKSDLKTEIEEYKAQIRFKNKLSSQNELNIISVNSFMDEDFLGDLKDKLCQNGVKLNPISDDRLMKMLEFIDFFEHFTDIKKLVEDFISSFKEHDVPDEEIYGYMGENDKEKFLLKFIADYYAYYQNYLDENGLLDYSDMILKAIPNVRGTDYDYIFVDEYQDISKIRYKLLKRIKEDSDAKLVVVGDDWQSIYGFSGCDVKYFANFKEYFPVCKEVYLNQTYRSSDQLISTAGEFVDDENLIRKELYSEKINEKPIKLWVYKKGHEFLMIYSILEEISKYAEDREVKILSRYNENVYVVRDKLDSICAAENLKLDITFDTFHRAKGLEAGNVIIIDVNDEVKGIPSKISDSGILRFVSFQGERSKQDMEERRLFYVGLTRTKNNVYLCADRTSISPYIKELNDEVIEKINYAPPRGFNPFLTNTKNIFKHFWDYKRLIKPFNLKCRGCQKGDINLYRINHDAFIACSEYGNGCNWFVDKKFDLDKAEFIEIDYCPKCDEGILYNPKDLKTKSKKKSRVCSNIRCGKKIHKNRGPSSARKGYGSNESNKVDVSVSISQKDGVSKKTGAPPLIEEILKNKEYSDKKSSLIKTEKSKNFNAKSKSSSSGTISDFCKKSDKFRDDLRNQAKEISLGNLNSDQKFALMQLDMFSISKTGKFSKDFKKSLDEKRVTQVKAYKIKKDIENLIILDIVKRNQVRSALKELIENAHRIYR